MFTHFSQPLKENNCKDDFKQTRTWTMMMNVVSSLEWVNRYIHTACLRAYMHVCVCVHKCILTATPVVWFNYSSQLVVILVWFCTVSSDFLRLHKYSPKDIDPQTRYILCILILYRYKFFRFWYTEDISRNLNFREISRNLFILI